MHSLNDHQQFTGPILSVCIGNDSFPGSRLLTKNEILTFYTSTNINCVIFYLFDSSTDRFNNLTDSNALFFNGIEEFSLIADAFSTFYIPSIAVISSSCSRVLLNFALLCTIRLSDEFATFPLTSLFYEHNSQTLLQQRFMKLINRNFRDSVVHSKDLVLTASDAHDSGLLNAVYTSNELFHQSFEFADKLINNRSRETIIAVMKCLVNWVRMPDHDICDIYYEEEELQFCQLVYNDYISMKTISND